MNKSLFVVRYDVDSGEIFYIKRSFGVRRFRLVDDARDASLFTEDFANEVAAEWRAYHSGTVIVEAA